MLRSMTGYARASAEGEWQELSWELRSVNHRYLDLSVYLPEEFRAIDAEVRARLGARLARGKLTAQLRFVNAGGAANLQPDQRLLAALGQALGQVQEQIPELGQADPLQVLRWPGVLQEPAVDYEALKVPVMQALDAAIDSMLANREREGASLDEILTARCASLEALVLRVREALPRLREEWREKLQRRLADIAGSDAVKVDPERLEQELLVILQRQDVDEEIDRLDTHIREVRDTLRRPEPVGRRLDFLMQELNREANTLTSKSQVSETTQIAVEMKVLIEQMREQVQNVE